MARSGTSFRNPDVDEMVSFFRHYRTYRGVGLTRNDALRFAWGAAVSGIAVTTANAATAIAPGRG